jgi:hypothetical protein
MIKKNEKSRNLSGEQGVKVTPVLLEGSPLVRTTATQQTQQ